VENPGYIALSRLIAQQRALDVRAANIANANTPGYKAESVVFSDYLLKQTGVTAPPGGQTVQMVQDRATYRDFNAGQLLKTGNPLDLALQESGFFTVSTAQGNRYTRAGRFSMSPLGQIIDIAGNPLLGTDGRPITVPPGSGVLTVDGDGGISSDGAPIGKFAVVQFDNPQSLKAEGGTLFSSTQAARPVAQPNVMQGSVEGANVQGIVEVTQMMAEMREFEFASQFVDGEAQREQTAIDRIGHKS
jgi:flagellar basal-body rod protein FlgF